MENFIGGFSVGLFVWLSAWGLNRVYLTFKIFCS